MQIVERLASVHAMALKWLNRTLNHLQRFPLKCNATLASSVFCHIEDKT